MGAYWGYNPLILTFDPNFQRYMGCSDEQMGCGDGQFPKVKLEVEQRSFSVNIIRGPP